MIVTLVSFGPADTAAAPSHVRNCQNTRRAGARPGGFAMQQQGYAFGGLSGGPINTGRSAGSKIWTTAAPESPGTATLDWDPSMVGCWQ